ncbi:MAG: hypothetical protein VX737_05910 [Pseudomonadota bacterium]|nr:hypothetical protein [Pseudomonadota bacterium]
MTINAGKTSTLDLSIGKELLQSTLDEMPRGFDINAYEDKASGNDRHDSYARLRQLRYQIRINPSLKNKQELQKKLYTTPMYQLNLTNVPYGLHKKSLQAYVNQSKQEKEACALEDEHYRDAAEGLCSENGKATLEFVLKNIKQLSNRNRANETICLKTEALKAQVLIGLNRYNEALNVLSNVNQKFQYDDYCLYLTAEALIERPQMFFLFGDKSNDLREAKLILDRLMPRTQVDKEDGEKDGAPLYESKHYLVWAKYHLARAKHEDTIKEKELFADKAITLAANVHTNSVDYRQAHHVIESAKACKNDIDCCWSPF